jgi:hypothetical protein
LPADGVNPCRKQYLSAAEVVESLRRLGLQDWQKISNGAFQAGRSDSDKRLKIGSLIKVSVWKKCHGCIKDSFA